MPKLLVTHVNPHLDDICAVWLFHRLHPDFSAAAVRFVNLSANGGETVGQVDADPDIAHIGVGRGRFDEHRGLTGETSTTLVWKELGRLKYQPKKDIERIAFERLVDFVFLEDTGLLISEERREFSVPAVIFGARGIVGYDSHKILELGEWMLDALLVYNRQQAMFERDWKSRIEFETPWGKGAVVETEFGSKPFVYRQGFTVAVFHSVKRGWYDITAPAESTVDFTAAYNVLSEKEPRLWYLHHGKKMLLTGGPVAPKVPASRFTPKEVIALLKLNLKSAGIGNKERVK